MATLTNITRRYLQLGLEVTRLNLKIIFANKFIYFLLAAVGIYILVTVIFLFDAESSMTEEDVYNLLLVPGLLIVFYPTTFGIQNDMDARMIEVLFGVPNYRYKVWLLRLALIYLILILFLLLLSLVSLLVLTPFAVMRMVIQLMFPILFMGCLAFFFSTLTRNGYGAAAIVVFIGIGLWLAQDFIRESKYNVFLNPFHLPRNTNEVIWAQAIIDNRLYLLGLALIAVLGGLYRLQQREKFMRG